VCTCALELRFRLLSFAASTSLAVSPKLVGEVADDGSKELRGLSKRTSIVDSVELDGAGDMSRSMLALRTRGGCNLRV